MEYSYKLCKNCKHSDGYKCTRTILGIVDYPLCYEEQDRTYSKCKITDNDVNGNGASTSIKDDYENYIKPQMKRIEDMAREMVEEENNLLNTDTLSLAEAVEKLREFGNRFTSWYGIHTNIESIELVEVDGNYSIVVKTKK